MSAIVCHALKTIAIRSSQNLINNGRHSFKVNTHTNKQEQTQAQAN